MTSLSYAVDTNGNNNNDAVVVSGSRDATLLVWYWNGKQQRISSNGKAGVQLRNYDLRNLFPRFNDIDIPNNGLVRIEGISVCFCSGFRRNGHFYVECLLSISID